MNKIELLSPAGNYDCFLAAINAGADAVYLSGEKFGARAYAKNFSEEELIRAIDYAHIFGRKIYMTVNTLLKDDELKELYNYILPYYEAGLDGVIVQDMGVISYIRKHFKDLPVHASTQLTITGLEGTEYLKDLGVVRTVLAREVSLEEIKYIHEHSDMEIECFVHGALCYSYSGKCLFSSLAGGRSGNRGRCAGPCRQPYNNEQYLLSTKDICCLSILPDLIEAGICSLKIEGRMKSPEYVAGVTGIYRKYIDIYYSHSSKEDIAAIKKHYFNGKQFDRDLSTLIKLYTRGGNSQGYYYRQNGRNMISISDASYKADKGDVKTQIADEYNNAPVRIPLTAYVSIHPYEPVSITINNKTVFYGELAEESLNRPIDEEAVRKQISKTKDTEFEFTEIECDISENAFVRVSALNELRRNIVSALRESRLQKYRRKIEPQAFSDEQYSYVKRECNNPDAGKTVRLCVETSDIEHIRTAIRYEAVGRIYIPYNIACRNHSIIEDVKESGKQVFIKFQSVIRHNYLINNAEEIMSVLKKSDGVLADSHEVIEFLKRSNFKGEVISDIHIYALNNEAESVYRSNGIDVMTVPVELNKKELYRRGIEGEELIVYGYLPMMISAQCVNNTVNGCDRKSKEIKLTDRKGMSFTAVNDCTVCNNIIYNCVPVSLHSETDFIDRINPVSLRLIFTIENQDRCNRIIELFSDYCIHGKINKNSADTLFSENSYSKGHLNRGVM